MNSPISFDPRFPLGGLAALALAACSVAGNPQNTTETSASGTGDPVDTTGASYGASESDSATAATTGTPTTTTGLTATESSDPSGPATETDPALTDTGTTSGGTESDTGAQPLDCDTFAQDCPEGQKCVPYSGDGSPEWNDTKCVPIPADPAAVGEPCTAVDGPVSGDDDCEKGALCFDVDEETGMGTCVALCAGDVNDPMCPEMTVCVISAEGSLYPCLPTCDPLAGADACAPEKVCIPASSGEYFICAHQADAFGPGEPCQFANVCDDGLLCTNGEFVPDCMDIGCCAPFCDLLAPDCSALPGTECVAYYDNNPPPEYENVGVCVAP